MSTNRFEATECRKKREYASKIINLVRERDKNLERLNNALDGLKNWERNNKIMVKIKYEDQFEELIEEIETVFENKLQDLLSENTHSNPINKSDN